MHFSRPFGTTSTRPSLNPSVPKRTAPNRHIDVDIRCYTGRWVPPVQFLKALDPTIVIVNSLRPTLFPISPFRRLSPYKDGGPFARVSFSPFAPSSWIRGSLRRFTEEKGWNPPKIEGKQKMVCFIPSCHHFPSEYDWLPQCRANPLIWSLYSCFLFVIFLPILPGCVWMVMEGSSLTLLDLYRLKELFSIFICNPCSSRLCSWVRHHGEICVCLGIV